MKILFVGPNQIMRYNPGHQLFRNEIARQHEVVFYGPKHPGFKPERGNVLELIEEHKPDILMTYGMKYIVPLIYNVGLVEIPKVHFIDDLVKNVGDFTGQWGPYMQMFSEHKYDLCFARTQRVVQLMKTLDVCQNTFLCAFSVDPNWFRRTNGFGEAARSIDVAGMMSTVNSVYPNRPKVLKTIGQVSGKAIMRRIFDDGYVETLNKTRIAVNSLNVWNAFNMRFTEICAMGAMLMTDRPDDFKIHGFKHGVNCILYDCCERLGDRLAYYLANEAERWTIAKAGYDLVMRRHTNEVRVRDTVTRILEESI